MWHRRIGHRDANHLEIVKGIVAAGKGNWKVLDLAAMGKDCPDVLVGTPRSNVLLEIKTAKGKLSPGQEKFFATWPGPKAVVRTVDEAASAVLASLSF